MEMTRDLLEIKEISPLLPQIFLDFFSVLYLGNLYRRVGGADNRIKETSVMRVGLEKRNKPLVRILFCLRRTRESAVPLTYPLLVCHDFWGLSRVELYEGHLICY